MVKENGIKEQTGEKTEEEVGVRKRGNEGKRGGRREKKKMRKRDEKGEENEGI